MDSVAFLDWEDSNSVDNVDGDAATTQGGDDADNNNNNNNNMTSQQQQQQQQQQQHQYHMKMASAAVDEMFSGLNNNNSTSSSTPAVASANNNTNNNTAVAAAALFGNPCMNVNIASLPPMPKQAQAPQTGWSGDMPFLFHQMPPFLSTNSLKQQQQQQQDTALSASGGVLNKGNNAPLNHRQQTHSRASAGSSSSASASASNSTTPPPPPSALPGVQPKASAAASTASAGKKRGGGGKKKKSPAGLNGGTGPPPPFMLFDAPCELRYNFAQTQQRYNMPLQVGANDFHYGVPVNGFHPQLNAQENPPVMLDARHCPKKATTDRNEREQKRAHKITELIEDLRVSMIDGGWNVQVKSKYHTLSTCQDYVRHLIKTTKEKEDEVNRVRQEADMKSFEVSGSEPESSISTMTSETAISRKRKLPKSESAVTSASSISSLTGSSKKSKPSDGADDGSVHSDAVIDVPGNDDPDDSASTICKNGTIIKPQEEKNASSNEPWVVQDNICYADVFMESNVPQLVATPAGRIIAWNNSLLKLTGASRNDVKRSTIFSLVQLDHLSKLFELVAKALRGGKRENNTDVVTLPCIPFDSEDFAPNPLYMTVTLINDENPSFRCFHCIITDQPGADGKVGYISKDILERIY
eukprot:CAMPEP_0196813530 /NCGR_PEP_ID=MMETSP1362-20130617/37366_1 /TAXON_ID=163516 /ORGANISM="Leptocylindrus danicus, Strain CCMP1856" /LENGTH=639 /DNA_ID=CAMNT_0042189809 /DNA_START=131 /DNA_END=2050 /DNA_ORIENTATION=+